MNLMKLPSLKSIYRNNRLSIKNAAWLLGDHLITFVGGLIVSVWLARYLGPALYGVYGFGMALIPIATSLAAFGLHGIVVKEFVQTDDINKSFGTVALLKSLGAVTALLSLWAYLYFIGIDGNKYLFTMILSLGLLLTPLTTIDNYFDSQVKSKWRVISRKVAFLIRSTLFVAFILCGWPFYTLAFILLFEAVIASLVSLWFFFKKGPKIKMSFGMDKSKKILSQSWPLVISGLGSILYLKMDQVMVVSMIDDATGGQYNAAVKYTSIFYILHTVVLTSLFPKLVEARQLGYNQFKKSIGNISSGLIYGALLVLIGTILFSGYAIRYSFGDQYLPAVAIINVHIFSLPFVYLGAVLSKWLIIENLTKLSIVRHGLGFVVNLILNLLLIPVYGAIGAAIASVLALFSSCFLVLFFHSGLKDLAWIFLRSLVLPFKLILR